MQESETIPGWSRSGFARRSGSGDGGDGGTHMASCVFGRFGSWKRWRCLSQQRKGRLLQVSGHTSGAPDCSYARSTCCMSPCLCSWQFPEAAGYVGFANLPNQVHRKSVKKGFEFTLMVVGESGLGKSTLINSLFLTDLYPERYIPIAAEKIERTVQIEASTVEIEERGVKLRLTVVDTPGYGDAINSQDCFKTIIQYIDNQFERYLHDESGLNRRHIVDNRVHCCFYFISPFGHGLKPLDVEFMKAIHSKVNIVPVIAKADTLTLRERDRLKRRVLDEIAEHGIRIYQLPDADSDEDEEFKEQTRVLKASIPFAVIGSNQLIEVKGKKIRGRLYPWGVVEVENPEHNDFLKLRTMLVTHMQDLQEVTQDLHYENFRSERLKRAGRAVEEDVVDKDQILMQKEAEVREGVLALLSVGYGEEGDASLPDRPSPDWGWRFGCLPQREEEGCVRTGVCGQAASDPGFLPLFGFDPGAYTVRVTNDHCIPFMRWRHVPFLSTMYSRDRVGRVTESSVALNAIRPFAVIRTEYLHRTPWRVQVTLRTVASSPAGDQQGPAPGVGCSSGLVMVGQQQQCVPSRIGAVVHLHSGSASLGSKPGSEQRLETSALGLPVVRDSVRFCNRTVPCTKVTRSKVTRSKLKFYSLILGLQVMSGTFAATPFTAWATDCQATYLVVLEKLAERLLSPRYRTARVKDKQYVGFATLPNQVHRKSVKKGFDFTLMVAGESGLGKSTLVNSLFLTDLYKDRKLLNAEERISQTVEIIKHTVDIEEKGVKLKLTIVDTPGFGDAVNNNECWKPITDYIDQQFEQYFRDESGLNRKNIVDNRVHCCLYFIPPFGHGLRPVDVEFIKALHEKVNVVPLISKADCLTPVEIKKLKDRESTPFAVIGSNTVVEAKGQRVRGRLYPWGIVEVENQSHCDFVKLRNMLIRTHMHDLKDVTCDVHYENYRAQCIQQMTSKLTQDNRMESPIPILPLPTPDVETEKLIKMKDEELKRMQEMLQKMQQQMHEQEQRDFAQQAESRAQSSRVPASAEEVGSPPASPTRSHASSLSDGSPSPSVKVRVARLKIEANEREKEREARYRHTEAMHKLELEIPGQHALEIRKLEIELEMRKLDIQAPGGHQPGTPSFPKPFDASRQISLVPQFRELEVDEYFESFERIATAFKWPEEAWGPLLQSKLTGKALRETVQESLGFSPAELVFGHTVRGPLKVLKDEILGGGLSTKKNVLSYPGTEFERRYSIFNMRGHQLHLIQLLYILLPLLASEGCPLHCTCGKGVVTCSSRRLTSATLPSAFPPDTTEIRLHDNQLTSLPNGLLDGLTHLHSVSLHGNPWVCDCGVLYLRSWLLKQAGRAVYSNVSCSSPPGLQGRLVMYLVEEEVLDSCQYWYCNLALASQVTLFILIALQAILLGFLIYFLRHYEKLSREARHTVEESFVGGEVENEYVMLNDGSA
ncbi:hypothetical protein AAFF_G00086690 [Aldrovandia affinis]|uniref:Septin-type G domain-containing protein n=1 Tax=Aldrovandia affinis TaxID=143900 RepID=A0AAD7RWK8_9TELE|nr:hypothetical protein AAFF_G00086690 [Aldrovandia affinis]